MLTNREGKLKRLIYLASPYTLNGVTDHAKRLAMEIRFHEISALEAALKEQYYKTHIFYGPIGSSHWVAKYMKPEYHTYDMWITETDDYWLNLADELWVVCLDKWDESKGVEYEIASFREYNKPIRYVNKDTLDFIFMENVVDDD